MKLALALTTLALTANAAVTYNAAFTDPETGFPSADLSIDPDTRQLSINIHSPWLSDLAGWQPTSQEQFVFTYWFNPINPPIVAVEDMPFQLGDTGLKLWKPVSGGIGQFNMTTEFTGPAIPEPAISMLVLGLTALVCRKFNQ